VRVYRVPQTKERKKERKKREKSRETEQGKANKEKQSKMAGNRRCEGDSG